MKSNPPDQKEHLLPNITVQHVRELFDANATDSRGRNTPVLALDDDGNPLVTHEPTPQANDWKVVYTAEDLLGYMGEEWDQEAGESLADELSQQLRDGLR